MKGGLQETVVRINTLQPAALRPGAIGSVHAHPSPGSKCFLHVSNPRVVTLPPCRLKPRQAHDLVTVCSGQGGIYCS